jgi:L-amino acid N-acyltransferase YncA
VSLQIREATQADLAGLAAVYNEVIATSTAVYAIYAAPGERRMNAR